LTEDTCAAKAAHDGSEKKKCNRHAKKAVEEGTALHETLQMKNGGKTFALPKGAGLFSDSRNNVPSRTKPTTRMSNVEQGMSNDKVADRMSKAEFQMLNVEGNSRLRVGDLASMAPWQSSFDV
jgi:hypothetical protein